RVGSCPANVEPEVATLRPAERLKALPKRDHVALSHRVTFGKRRHHADVPYRLALLRPCHQRPRSRRAAEPRGERASPHPITSSARTNRVSGIVRPSALAVVRLMRSWNFVGCSTGRSLGLAPRRILST